ncbi:remorin-like [Curcuma longa]|uniref:remorin-like n=1 Tax=Curcuma longa TaxID=136217 RepID=UPI003D9DECD7
MTEEKAAAVVAGARPEPVLKDVEEEKATIVPAPEERPKFSMLLAEVQNHEEPSAESRSTDRGATLARALKEKRLSLIKAWEENEKVESESRAVKKIAEIVAWENSKKAEAEAEQKKKEEKLEKKKAEYAEKMRNKIASIRKEAEAKKAIIEAKQGKEVIKVEETAAKYRSAGFAPKKIWGFLGR